VHEVILTQANTYIRGMAEKKRCTVCEIKRQGEGEVMEAEQLKSYRAHSMAAMSLRCSSSSSKASSEPDSLSPS